VKADQLGFSVPSVSNILETAAKSLWPALNLKALFVPMQDLSKGDLGTDFPLQIAAQLKISSRQVLQKLMPLLPQDIPYLFTVYDDYLNLRFPNLSRENLEALASIYKVDIDGFNNSLLYLIPALKECCGWEYLRLASIVMLQARFFVAIGIPATIVIGDEVIVPSTYLDSRNKFIAEVLWQKVKPTVCTQISVKDLALQVENLLDTHNFKNCYVWSYDQLWRGKAYLNITQKINLISRHPFSTFLKGIDLNIRAEEVQEWRGATLNALQFHLASELAGHEVDIDVSKNQESANLTWYLSASLQRLKSLDLESFQNTAAPIKFSIKQRELWIRVSFLQTSLHLATCRADIWYYLSVLRDTLDRLNQIVGDPKFRASLHRKDLDTAFLYLIDISYRVLYQTQINLNLIQCLDLKDA